MVIVSQKSYFGNSYCTTLGPIETYVRKCVFPNYVSFACIWTLAIIIIIIIIFSVDLVPVVTVVYIKVINALCIIILSRTIGTLGE